MGKEGDTKNLDFYADIGYKIDNNLAVVCFEGGTATLK